MLSTIIAQQLGITGFFSHLAALWIVWKISQHVSMWRVFGSRSVVRTTSLRGPANESILFGVDRRIHDSEDAGALYEQWANEFGSAYKVPGGFGSSRIIICDPKANAHFYSKETFGYVQTKLTKIFIENLFGRGLLWAEGESHRRQRKALSPAFSNASIRRLTPIFYDSAYKMKANWDQTLDASPDGCLIEVQKWMNYIPLDTIGIAGFGHDFGSLDGKKLSVFEVSKAIESLGTSSISNFVFLMGPVLPMLLKLPAGENGLFMKLRVAMSEIADELLERMRKEKEGGVVGKAEEKSIIGLLVKAEMSNTELQMSKEEVVAQMNVLLLAGYETTSTSLTWALIELSRKLDKQEKLRQELAQFTGVDPTWEQLASELPYLDAVVQEVLRLHPPVVVTTRVATEDDIMPLSTPVVTSTGETVSTLTIAKGTVVTSPIHTMNRSEVFWGPNAKDFEPERWLEDINGRAKEIGGHRHILSFSDGPRFCLGKNFALTEFKAALLVLIRYYRFELPDGPDTKIVNHKSVMDRPKVAGQDGPKVPMKVRRVD